MYFKFFTILLIFNIGLSQIHEIGPLISGTNYVGDIGNDQFINPNQLGFGIIYRWNKSPRHSYRFHYNYGMLKGDDALADSKSRNMRGLTFDNRVHELGLTMEFNFFEFDLHQFGFQATPYVATGFNVFNYKEQYFLNNNLNFDSNNWSYSIPIILGIKTKLTRSLVLGGEVGVRYALTNNLDGSDPKNTNYSNLRFGNLNSNDWYVFTGFYLTFTFGDNPCFCPF